MNKKVLYEVECIFSSLGGGIKRMIDTTEKACNVLREKGYTHVNSRIRLSTEGDIICHIYVKVYTDEDGYVCEQKKIVDLVAHSI